MARTSDIRRVGVMRVLAPLAATAVAVALAAPAMAAPAGRTLGQSARPAQMVPAGQTAGRSAVPWRKVGAGWSLVTYTTATPFAARPRPGATTLYLVDPAGGKYVMYRWAHVPADGGVNLLAWSGDGKRAMLDVAKSPTSSAERLDQLTLATGRLARLPLPASTTPISYTRPDGLAVLAYHFMTSPLRIQIARYSLSGKLEKVLYTQKPTSNNGGFISFGQSPYNPSGTALALTAAPAGPTRPEHTVLISNAGGLIRTFSSAGSCLDVRWWTVSQLLTANCAISRLFVTPVNGAKPSPLTPASTSSIQFVQDALLLAGHVYVQLSGPACGTGSLGVVRNGRLASVRVPKVTRGATIVTASGSRLLIVSEGCMGSSGLLLFNPASSAEVQVLKKNQGQGVTGWVPYYELAG
jgi:hypothetical protein